MANSRDVLKKKMKTNNMNKMKQLSLIILLLACVACGDNTAPSNQSDIYGIWEGSHEIENAATDISLYCELLEENTELWGQAEFQGDFYTTNNGTELKTSYYRSGEIKGNYIYPNVKFSFKNETGIIYSYQGLVNSTFDTIRGTMTVHDPEYIGDKDTTIIFNIDILKQIKD